MKGGEGEESVPALQYDWLEFQPAGVAQEARAGKRRQGDAVSFFFFFFSYIG